MRGELDDMSNGGFMREEGEWFGWELRDLNFFFSHENLVMNSAYFHYAIFEKTNNP